MAIYHLSAQPIGRSAGRSTTAASAYRAGEKIIDQRTGEIHDYRKKQGVLHTEMILPGGGTVNRAEFWNRLEAHHKRGDAVLAREVEVSLPAELSADERRALATRFARELCDRHGVAADVALHAPRTVTDRDLEKKPDLYFEIDPATGRRHNGNWHSHIMLSACYVSASGELGKKAVELDPIHCQRAKIGNAVDWARSRWAALANEALERAGHSARIDHRSHAERGISEAPSVHLGPAAAGFERRTGVDSQVRQAAESARAKILAELAVLEKQARELSRSIIAIGGEIGQAVFGRYELQEEQRAELERQREKVDQARRAILADDQGDQDPEGPAPGM
jgi:ATP-dependent exoDNAse (exonuclease V) alpha subunit